MNERLDQLPFVQASEVHPTRSELLDSGRLRERDARMTILLCPTCPSTLDVSHPGFE